MRKVAFIFVLTVLVPSLVLAWLAVRSLRDQQFVIERQQSLLYQGVVDSLAREASGYLDEQQQKFASQVELLLQNKSPEMLAYVFDDKIRTNWPMAEVGFVVSVQGNKVMSPSLTGRAEARQFRLDNDRFLCNVESVEVYWNTGKGAINLSALDQRNNLNNYSQVIANTSSQLVQSQQQSNYKANSQSQTEAPQGQSQSGNNTDYQNKPAAKRTVSPQNQVNQQIAIESPNLIDNTYSKVQVAEAEFRQLIGDSNEGMMARFLQNRLNVMTWYRSPRHPELVFGAKLDLAKLTEGLKPFVNSLSRELQTDVCVALLDDSAHPLNRSHTDFTTAWKRPFVAAEIGEALPHWEIALYLLNPNKLTASAITLKVTLSLLIAVLVLAIVIGSWLIVRDLERELRLSRQKTDFVSNVSHELKTPLTSIRMFAELLADGRVQDPEKQRSYLSIITAESARLTRLINNVLDFAHMERGEKKYQMRSVDLVATVKNAAKSLRAQLETAQFKLKVELPEQPVIAKGDADALAQVMVNLLSNAEKYSGESKEITVTLKRAHQPFAHAEIQVMDRGTGVPKGCEEKIFEQFYRAHDSLSSGIQGSGLGLTLARQIARAHGGELSYAPREGGGSCFTLKLPVTPDV